MPPIEVFCCYARKDELILKELKSHLMLLQRQGIIKIWHDADVSPGTKWEEEVNAHLNSAQIILLLISSDFMNSDYCYSKEMARAMERHTHGEAHVIPIILRPVYWKGASFGELQALPSDAHPIKSPHWHSSDEAFVSVVEGIRSVIDKLSQAQLTDEDSANNETEQNTIFQNKVIFTGFKDLDHLTGGLYSSDLVIVGGPESSGKTSFALYAASHLIHEKKHSIGIFSLEMKKERLIQRLLVLNTRIPYQHLTTNRMEDYEWEDIGYAMEALIEANLWIYDSPTLTISELRNMAQRMVREAHVDLIIIDSIDFILKEADQKRYNTNIHEREELSFYLRLLARELDIPVLALARKPHLKADLFQDSSPHVDAIDMYADIVLFLHREELRNEYTERINILDIIVTKNKCNILGEVSIHFNSKTSTMRELEEFNPENLFNDPPSPTGNMQ